MSAHVGEWNTPTCRTSRAQMNFLSRVVNVITLTMNAPRYDSPPSVGHKSVSTRRTLDTLKVDAPHLGRRNHAATLGAHRIERCPHLFEIDLPRAWHGSKLF